MTAGTSRPTGQARSEATLRPVADRQPDQQARVPAIHAFPRLLQEAWAYQVDFWQRSVMFLDVLRERANNMLAHEQAGLPPLLNFEYETILDARRFERPANYALLCSTAAGEECRADFLDRSIRLRMRSSSAQEGSRFNRRSGSKTSMAWEPKGRWQGRPFSSATVT